MSNDKITYKEVVCSHCKGTGHVVFQNQFPGDCDVCGGEGVRTIKLIEEEDQNPNATEQGTFENQFNRKMNQLIKAIENPKKIRLNEIINRIDELDPITRTTWVNRIITEFSEDITMKTLLVVKKGEVK